MSHQLIPLNLLVTSAANVRRTDKKADLISLMASIKAHGLLQNLSVQKRDETHFEVVAGGRRHAALKALAKAGEIARDFPVPCLVIGGDGASEASLAENVERVAMDAMDEAEAFSALAGEDFSVDAIAQRFGVTSRHVEQRIALAALSPKLKSAYRRGDLNLDAARAFCIEPDHVKQDAVFKALGKPVTSAGQVRALLSEGAMKSSDRIAVFVGLGAYEHAGGALTRDLFDDGNIFIADPDLMTRLANDKLESMRTALLGQGWGWVETSSGQPQAACVRRIHARQRPMTKSEKKRLAELDARIDAIDEILDAADSEDQALAEEHDGLDTARDALVAGVQVWDAQEMALAGVAIGIDYSGKPALVHGLVKKEHQAALKKLQAPARDDAAAPDASPEQTVPVRQFSKALTRELTAVRADALRSALLSAPRAGLAVAAFALVHVCRQGAACGVDIRAAANHDGHKDIARAQTLLLADAPEDEAALLAWCLERDQDHLIALMALAAAAALDLAHDGQFASDHLKQQLADVLAQALELDMAAAWRPDLAFWSRVSKAELMTAIASAPALTKLSERRREKELAAYAKLKRDELAKRAAKLLKTSAWLPDILITPMASGAVELTDAGEAALGETIAA